MNNLPSFFVTQPASLKVLPLVVSLVVAIGVWAFPLLSDSTANLALIVLILAASLWITEAIPLSLTALLIPVLAIVLGLLSPSEAFSQFGNPVMFLFMGGFVLAGALASHSIDQVLAQKLIGLANGNFYRSAILLMLCTSLLAAWISNTSATAMMIPLGLGLLALSNRENLSAESKFLMLGIAYSANLGGIITIIGTPPNAIGATILKLSFIEWLKYGVPIFLITFPVMVLVLTLFFRPDRKIKTEKIEISIGKIKHKKRLIFIFLFTVSLWLADGLLSSVLNIASSFNAVVAIFAIFMLFTLRVMKWEEILASIHWDILLLFGGGLTLGLLVEHSGLGTILISGVIATGSGLSMFFLLWLVIVFSIMLTEFMSNTASAALILPLLYTMAVQLQINPLILVLPATIASSYGFMLPVGTPPNAMVFSLGYIPQRQMIRVGMLLNLVFSILLALFFYLLL